MRKLQRMQACLFVGLAEPANEYTVLLQQTFYATAELENTLLKERKRRSIPGAVPTTQHGLLSKEDLSIETQEAAVLALDCAPGWDYKSFEFFRKKGYTVFTHTAVAQLLKSTFRILKALCEVECTNERR